ncbi:unnamed protein product [Prorocentrum cordatum]|uniref:Pentacotripeptide-repeat region of PRORP domain-containing protein n=1 Tax=Prorocentrum cordatum TaxID=2364126 RepID=A0ABN9TDY2_9DINO|nr:unnamed protein product [Polarella glacialis]
MGCSSEAAPRGTAITRAKQHRRLHFRRHRVRKGAAVAARIVAARRGCGYAAGEEHLFSYSAGISACEKGEQWQRALALLGEVWEAKLEPNVISYNAGISACEKGGQWQPALALLTVMREAQLDPDVIYQLQRWDQRVREGRTVAAGLDTTQRYVGCELGAQRHLYSAGISACEKGEQWQRAFALLSEMREAEVKPNVIYYTIYNSGISACGKGGQWQRALSLLSEMWKAKLKPTATYYTSTTLGLVRARRASSGSGLWCFSARCGRSR